MVDRFETFATTISQINKYMQKIKTIEMKEFELKGTHVMCLFELNHHPNGLTVTQLASQCDEDKAAISRIVADLTKRQLVTTDSEKKYRAPILLTKEGKEIADQIDTLASKAVEAGGEGLTKRQREVLYVSLNHIAENLRIYLEQ